MKKQFSRRASHCRLGLKQETKNDCRNPKYFAAEWKKENKILNSWIKFLEINCVINYIKFSLKSWLSSFISKTMYSREMEWKLKIAENNMFIINCTTKPEDTYVQVYDREFWNYIIISEPCDGDNCLYVDQKLCNLKSCSDIDNSR